MTRFDNGMFWHFCPVCGKYTDESDAAGICFDCLDKADNIADKERKGIASAAERAFTREVAKVQRNFDNKVRNI